VQKKQHFWWKIIFITKNNIAKCIKSNKRKKSSFLEQVKDFFKINLVIYNPMATKLKQKISKNLILSCLLLRKRFFCIMMKPIKPQSNWICKLLKSKIKSPSQFCQKPSQSWIGRGLGPSHSLPTMPSHHMRG